MRRPSRGASIGALGGFIGLTSATAAAGSAAVASGQRTWYRTLAKPPFNPPAWLFGPVWTLLYIMMAISAWRVWRRPDSPERTQALRRWALQLGLNAAWSPLFFGAQMPKAALANILALWAAIVLYTDKARRVDQPAAALMLPYLAWVTFASALNEEIVRLNP